MERRRRKLKVLVITMGSSRQGLIEELFADPEMAEHFEPPTFSPGIPSRTLSNRYRFLRIANDAGLIPKQEWEAIEKAEKDSTTTEEALVNPTLYQQNFFRCLNDVAVTDGRRGSNTDIKLHYSVELWRKAKSINRGRAVLACTFAHLIAMRTFLEGSFDVILEDNVRAAPSVCAHRIWESIDAMKEWETTTGKTCHVRFVGWLGSTTNLEWILKTHAPKRKFTRTSSESTSTSSPDGDLATIFPFPRPEHLVEDMGEMEAAMDGSNNNNSFGVGEGGGVVTEEDEPPQDDEDANITTNSTTHSHTRPGGNPVWGCYAYWISSEAYQQLMDTLRNDVGAILWKGNRMRNYLVKPIDKILPRQIMSRLGPDSVQLSSHPTFFRAPMLTSKIHTKWDPEFCKSTEYQLQNTGCLDWSDLWLSRSEREVVDHHSRTGVWLTLAELSMLRKG